jgi:curved DNA-binding protein
MDKDYYKIMGVSQNATDQDIKSSYRRLARKYHPDLSKEPNAEELFKEMGEAYETLKDPVKRAEYDRYLQNKEFNQRQSYQHQPTTGQHYEGKISISLDEAYKGTVKSIQIPGEHDKPQTLNVKIPAGVKSGQKIRLAGQGAKSVNNGPPGDIYLTVDVLKHPLFDVMDNDIYLTLPITPWEAALGTTVVVPTLAGKIDLKIPSNSQSGQKLRIKERGLPGPTPGNQYILLKIITPAATTDAQKEIYKKMAEIMPFNPREKLGV